MLDFLKELYDVNAIPLSYQWDATTFWLHFGSAVLLALLCYWVAVRVFYLAYRRQELAFRWSFILLGVFVAVCGTNYWLEVWTIWKGTYRLAGLVQLVAGVVIFLAALRLRPLLSQTLAFPGPAVVQELERKLDWEVRERHEAEKIIRQINEDLAKRIRNRTAELEARNKELQSEIAERRKAEEAMRKARDTAEAANAAKSVFLANMSHEIRTPLTGIIGFSGMLAKQASGKHQEYARRIEESGHRLMDTLNALLTLARLEADRSTLQLEALNVSKEVHAIVRYLQPQAQKKNLALTLTVQRGAEHAYARVDRGALNSILYNLVGNGIKFTKQGSVAVTIRIDRTYPKTPEASPSSQVCLQIRDTGVGIDPAFMPHIFEPFRQESSGMSRSHEGSGLGLAITKQLVDLVGGEITVESRKGSGSIFSVFFPLVAETPGLTTAVPAMTMLADGAQARMLVVEDNRDTQLLIQSLLEDVGDVRLASNAEEALHEVQNTLANSDGAFDVVLMDINLGNGPSGKEVLSALRAMPAYREVPVAALTAYALPGDQETFLNAGFNAYLSKPFSGDALLSMVSHLLQH